MKYGSGIRLSMPDSDSMNSVNWRLLNSRSMRRASGGTFVSSCW